MPSQAWEELVDSLVVNGTQVSNTVTETIVCPDFNVPAFYMQPGRVLQVTAYGVCSNVVTTPGTLTYRIRWGGVAGVVLVASLALPLDATARTNYGWRLQAHITCRTAGATGTFNTCGYIMQNNQDDVVAALQHIVMPRDALADVTVDTTTNKLLSVTAQFSVATSPTNLTCFQRIVEVLN
jgi:hypothetical protein